MNEAVLSGLRKRVFSKEKISQPMNFFFSWPMRSLGFQVFWLKLAAFTFPARGEVPVPYLNSLAKPVCRSRRAVSYNRQCQTEDRSGVNLNGLGSNGSSNPELIGQHWLQLDRSYLRWL